MNKQEEDFQRLLDLAASLQVQPPDSLWTRIDARIRERQPESGWGAFVRGIGQLFELPDLQPAGVALVLALTLSGGLIAIRSGMENPLLAELQNYDLEVPENPFMLEFTGNSNPFYNGGVIEMKGLRFVPAFALSAILLGAGGLAQIREGQVRPQEKIQVQALLQEKLRFAASQHEIVTLLIDDGRFEEAEAGYYELLDLRFSGPQEKLLVQSVWKIVEKLRNAGQHEVAHRIVAGTLRELAQLENRHTLLMLRAKLYQEQGSLSKALETLRQAKALVSSE